MIIYQHLWTSRYNNAQFMGCSGKTYLCGICSEILYIVIYNAILLKYIFETLWILSIQSD